MRAGQQVSGPRVLDHLEVLFRGRCRAIPSDAYSKVDQEDRPFSRITGGDMDAAEATQEPEHHQNNQDQSKNAAEPGPATGMARFRMNRIRSNRLDVRPGQHGSGDAPRRRRRAADARRIRLSSREQRGDFIACGSHAG